MALEKEVELSRHLKEDAQRKDMRLLTLEESAAEHGTVAQELVRIKSELFDSNKEVEVLSYELQKLGFSLKETEENYFTALKAHKEAETDLQSVQASRGNEIDTIKET